ncbi:MAG: hypothetical protein EOM45_03680 [Clostridia bacterium]|nr:hypothetical protein [Clostridia bacterium]
MVFKASQWLNNLSTSSKDLPYLSMLSRSFQACRSRCCSGKSSNSERASSYSFFNHVSLQFLSKKWKESPLVSLARIISLIGLTTTKKGLKVQCGLDTNEYETRIEVPEGELNELNISGDEFHGEWYYWVTPSETFP